MDEILRTAIVSIDEKYFERGERDFSYELYHQLRSIISSTEIEVTCETGKRAILDFQNPVFQNRLITKYFFKSDGYGQIEKLFRIPDLLVHQYSTYDFQLLAIEIKKSFVFKDIYYDLAKLAIYCNSILQYEKGILVLLNSSEERIRNAKEIQNFLTEFPELEIWIVRHGQSPIIICRDNI